MTSAHPIRYRLGVPLLALLLPVSSMRVARTADSGGDSRVVYETEIDADINAIWNAFTTKEGLQEWMAPLVEIDLAVGGKMKANYSPNGKIGDPATIENTILSFDPKRMLSLKATKFPEGFPFEDAAKATWSVFYFAQLPSSRTKVTVVGLGYSDSEQSRKMRSFFAIANKQSLDKLKDALKKQRLDEQSDGSQDAMPIPSGEDFRSGADSAARGKHHTRLESRQIVIRPNPEVNSYSRVGVDDQDADGDVAYTIVTSSAASADPLFDGIDPRDVAVVNVDNEQPGITRLTYNAFDDFYAMTDGGYIGWGRATDILGAWQGLDRV